LAIHEYIDQRNPAAAVRVGASIREAAEILRYFPYSGRRGRVAGTREWVVRRLPYVLVYEIDTDESGVTVLGVFTAPKNVIEIAAPLTSHREK
jgi:plasmid stabilization system protein ParE